jgi:hypothetical protein
VEFRGALNGLISSATTCFLEISRKLRWHRKLTLAPRDINLFQLILDHARISTYVHELPIRRGIKVMLTCESSLGVVRVIDYNSQLVTARRSFGLSRTLT